MAGPFRARPWLSALAALLLALVQATGAGAGEKKVIGAVEQVTVGEAGLPFLARVDSGARVCSIHATSIRVEEGGSPELAENVGKEISFRVENARGDDVKLRATLEKIMVVRSAVGTEERPAVYLTLESQGVKKKVLVSLRDREEMDYKLLLGRNWLEGDFLVDVSRNATE
ncbi:MAG: ATP-dependent zinc protease [Deltaproteobacteria bacterium]|nr:ATP-dependent zinc protease [Deltaproteobacteria bacterium]